MRLSNAPIPPDHVRARFVPDVHCPSLECDRTSKAMVERRQWLAQRDMLDGIALTRTKRGPLAAPDRDLVGWYRWLHFWIG